MANNNWKITCLHYGTLSCYKSLFDGGLDEVRYPFVYCGYLLQKIIERRCICRTYGNTGRRELR